MHMADALLSPAVGGTLWAASAGAIVWCSREMQADLDDRRVPFMGVLGAFVFAAQMINFTIPATGSSGHLGGGLLLAILLGPRSALLTMASVLTVQALFFADGGLLALGSNIFNLGVIPCLVAYPLCYRKVAGADPTRRRILAGSLLASITGLQLGAFGVVLATVSSGISELPFGPFTLLMQLIHLAIGMVEGLATAAVVTFVRQVRPEVLGMAEGARPAGPASWKGALAGLLAAALVTSGGLSWFASAHPDGLEWAISRATGGEGLAEPKGTVHTALAGLQERTAILPGYGFGAREASPESAAAGEGTSVSGFVGGLLTLVLVGLAGLLLKKRPRRP